MRIITPESVPVLHDFDAVKSAMAEHATRAVQFVSMGIDQLALVDHGNSRSSTQNLEFLPYVMLRPTKYGAFNYFRGDCPIIASDMARVTSAIIEREHVTAESVSRFIDTDPEYREIAITQQGDLAIVTRHTHDRGNPYETMETGELANDALFDDTAIENGYTPTQAFADFLRDLEMINVFRSGDTQVAVEPAKKTGILRLFSR